MKTYLLHWLIKRFLIPQLCTQLKWSDYEKNEYLCLFKEINM